MNNNLSFEISSGDITRTVEARQGETVVEAVRRSSVLEDMRRTHDVSLPAPCAGRGRCGRCRIILDNPGSAEVPPLHEAEEELLSEKDVQNGVRLACQLHVVDGMKLRLEKTVAARIETRVEGFEGDMDPILVKRVAVPTAGSLEDQRSMSARVEDELGLIRGSLPHSLIRLLPSIPDGKTPVTVVLDDDTPVALDVGEDTSDALWAAAVDIGTTTVAMYLVNLADEEVTGSKAELNAQSSFGADVISRLEHARKGETESLELQKIITNQLARMLGSLTGEFGVDASDIHLLAVAGNTAMIHLMNGWDARGLGEAPFLPGSLESPAFNSEEIGITGFPRLRIWPLPSLSAYVGADITGGLIASGMKYREGTDLLLDIGTNGEMAIGGVEGLLCCSTAAGPAFEGAHLSSGSGSVAGAVDHVDWSDAKLSYSTIDGTAPIGFCGSGVVDLVAFLVKSGLMDETGRIADGPTETDSADYSGLEFSSGEYGTELRWPAPGPGFTQKDLREVQLAKAAIRAGIDTLLGHAGIEAKEIGTLWLAGGFGNYIRPESAAAIGLIPRELAGKTRSLGNAAARGALLCLLSRKYREDSRSIAREAVTIELSGRPEFQNAYIEAMMFPTDGES